MSEVPVEPPWYQPLKASIQQLQMLKGSPGYREYSACLVNMLVGTFFDFLEAKTGDDLIRLQARGQSLQAILGVVDDQCNQRAEAAARVDAAMASVREGRPVNAAAQAQPWRSRDHIMHGR